MLQTSGGRIFTEKGSDTGLRAGMNLTGCAIAKRGEGPT